MTIKDIISEVHDLGLTCRYNAEYREFRIDYVRTDVRWTADSAAFTDREDAIGTARAMAAFQR